MLGAYSGDWLSEEGVYTVIGRLDISEMWTVLGVLKTSRTVMLG